VVNSSKREEFTFTDNAKIRPASSGTQFSAIKSSQIDDKPI
jgi:hypothetical protein